jgi:hypothetical protein
LGQPSGVTETEGPECNHRTARDPGKSSFEDHPVLGFNKGVIQNYFADKILPMIINNLPAGCIKGTAGDSRNAG